MGEQQAASKRVLPSSNGRWFRHGIVNGFPICMGYFAVSFALGIAAKNVNMNALQALFMSAGMVASAGEFAAITLIGAAAGVIEMITTSIIVNLRYFLMSCSLTQKLDPKLPFYHRFFLSYCMTDEIFGLSVSVSGYLNPFYTYGMMVISVTGWSLGTVLGVLVGNIIPVTLSNALSVAIYGMFLAIIIPPGKTNPFILKLVILSMGLSGLFHILPYLKTVSSGFQIIILTLAIAGIAAVIRPVSEEEENANVEADAETKSEIDKMLSEEEEKAGSRVPQEADLDRSNFIREPGSNRSEFIRESEAASDAVRGHEAQYGGKIEEETFEILEKRESRRQTSESSRERGEQK